MGPKPVAAVMEQSGESERGEVASYRVKIYATGVAALDRLKSSSRDD